jgi:hypothetical protein
MAKRIVRSSKTTIGKAKKTAPVILKEVSEKAISPAGGGDRLPTRERKTLLTMARVLAGKLR